MRRSSARVVLLIVMASMAVTLQGCGVIETVIRAVGRASGPSEWFAAPTGNDANDCESAATPCATIGGVLRRASIADTLFLAAGTYRECSLSFPTGFSIRGAGTTLSVIELRPECTGSQLLTVPGRRRLAVSDLTLRGSEVHGVQVDSGAVLTLTAVEVRDHGRAGILSNGRLIIERSSILRNRSGIEASGTLEVTDTTVRENGILESGGGISNRGTARLVDVVIEGNGRVDAASGGSSTALINSGMMTMENGRVAANAGTGASNRGGGSLELTNVSLVDNGGVGLWNEQGVVSIQDSVVARNGAGILIGGRSGLAPPRELRLDRTAVVGNGFRGIQLDHESLGVITNATIAGNGAAGIWMSESRLTVSHITLVGSVSEAGVLTVGGNTLSIGNSIVALNAVQQCVLDPRTSLTMGPRNIACEGAAAYPTAAALGLSALAEEGGTWIHPLLEASPAVDAADTATCPATDQRGVGRPIGGGCDLGAYERAFALTAGTTTPQPTLPAVPSLVASATATGVAVPVGTLLQNANCRSGPGTAYPITTSLLQGEEVTLEGRNSESTWWWILLSGGHCWLSGITVEIEGDAGGLPVIAAPPPPATATNTPAPTPPAAPQNLAITGEVCSASQYTVTIGWADVANESGYRVYRDGNLIATLGANATGYTDTPPNYQGHTYGVEAYNAAGTSSRPTVNEDGCLY